MGGISADGINVYSGGIIGDSKEGRITNSRFMGNISTTSFVTGSNLYSGGIIGNHSPRHYYNR